MGHKVRGQYNNSDELPVARDIVDGSTHNIRSAAAAAAAAADVCTAGHVTFDPRVIAPVPLCPQAALRQSVTSFYGRSSRHSGGKMSRFAVVNQRALGKPCWDSMR